jgi:hypothetical protein
MAVSARLANPTTLSNLHVQMQWDFFDPADPANSGVSLIVPPAKILHTEIVSQQPEQMSVAALTSLLTRIATQVQQGQVVVASLNTNVPSGTIVALV